jgi:glycosyltransferase involved in cell wall biosynthesis
MKPLGGSELMYYSLMKYMINDFEPDINLVSSMCDFNLIQEGRINILWQELNYDQENVMLMANEDFVNKIDYFVYASSWQYEKFRYIFHIPENRSRVIKNWIEPIPYVKKPNNGKLKLIYTSTPWRGLSVLLDCFEKLNRDDVELDVYSSTIIYGKSFDQQFNSRYIDLFNRAKSMKNVNYMGYASNSGVRKALQSAHIFAYPSIFEETSCISAIEAAAAGCKLLVTNYGALFETCSDWATYVNYTKDHDVLVDSYTAALNKAIDEYDHNDPFYKDQSNHYNKFWSWDARMPLWKNLIKDVKK